MAPSLMSWRPSSRNKRSNSEGTRQLHARWGDISISAPNGGGWNQKGFDPVTLNDAVCSTSNWNDELVDDIVNTAPHSPPLVQGKPRNGITITIPFPWIKRSRRPSLDVHVASEIAVPPKAIFTTVSSKPEQTTSPCDEVKLPPTVLLSGLNQHSPAFQVLSPVTEVFSKDGSQETLPTVDTPIYESPMSAITPGFPEHSKPEDLSGNSSCPPKEPSRPISMSKSPDLNRHSADRSSTGTPAMNLVENEERFKRLSRIPVSDETISRRSPPVDNPINVSISQKTSRRRTLSREPVNRRAASQQPTERRAMSREPLARRLSYTSLQHSPFSPTTSVSSASDEDEIIYKNSSEDDVYLRSQKIGNERQGIGLGGFYGGVVRDYQLIARNVGIDSLYNTGQKGEARMLEKVFSPNVKVADSVEYIGSQVLVPSAEELWG